VSADSWRELQSVCKAQIENAHGKRVPPICTYIYVWHPKWQNGKMAKLNAWKIVLFFACFFVLKLKAHKRFKASTWPDNGSLFSAEHNRTQTYV